MRQAHVQQQSHILQHLYGDYLGAVEKARWGEGGGAGGSQGHSVQAFDGCFEANLWDYSVTTMRKEREHGSTVTSPGGRGLSSRSPQQSLTQQARTSTEAKASG